MAISTNDIIVTSLDTITAFDITTGDYLFTLDELQSATISQSEDTTEITGRQGRRLSTLKTNKSIEVTGTNGLISGGLMELQTGSDFEHNDNALVLKSERLTVTNAGTAETKVVAKGTVGNEIYKAYVVEDQGFGDVYTQDSETAAGKFTYNPGSKTITFAQTDLSDVAGKTILVYYKAQVSADELKNDAGEYAKKAALYIDATGEDTCANEYHLQFYIPKADFDGTFDIQMGDDQAVHEFTASSLAGACGAEGQSYLFTYTVFQD